MPRWPTAKQDGGPALTLMRRRGKSQWLLVKAADEFADRRRNRVEPKVVGQVAFTEWTGAGQLRHPRYLGLRRDKDPATVTREVAR